MTITNGRPRVTTPGTGPEAEMAATATDTTIVRRGSVRPPGSARQRPPLAPASVYAPLGRRRWWWYCYPCRTCGNYQFGRAKTLDAVTGVRRAGCGHEVNVMIARTYGTAA